ncbi:MAG TPA: ANTAR domain-containing protein [Streptosporangiaceae bacterium]|nr:ANTAR domain-containing protein [Streptosporangiaceae bacterium]
MTDAIAKPATPSQQAALLSCAAPCSVRDIEDVLRGLARSAEPAVVLSSLARRSRLAFSDACAIVLSEGTDALFQVSFPSPGAEGDADEAVLPEAAGPVRAAYRAAALAGKTVTTAFEQASGHGYASFAGVAVHTWIGREPAPADTIVARLLVDYALGIVQQERLTRAAAWAEDRAAKLAVELITSRAEGEAIGLLMARHRVTREEAASMLRRSSGTTGRPLHEVAADVVRTRDVQPAPPGTAGAPARPRPLHIAGRPGHPGRPG